MNGNKTFMLFVLFVSLMYFYLMYLVLSKMHKEPFVAAEQTYLEKNITLLPSGCFANLPIEELNKDEMLFAYTMICQPNNQNVLADHMFILCKKNQLVANNFQDGQETFECQSTGWVQLH